MESAHDHFLHRVFEKGILTDNLSEIDVLLAQNTSEDLIVASIKKFLEGRRNIETSWDYQATYATYDEALELLNKFSSQASEEKRIVNWLKAIIEGHKLLEQGEADWTLCNFNKSSREYSEAAKSFRSGSLVMEFGSLSFADIRYTHNDHSVCLDYNDHLNIQQYFLEH